MGLLLGLLVGHLRVQVCSLWDSGIHSRLLVGLLHLRVYSLWDTLQDAITPRSAPMWDSGTEQDAVTHRSTRRPPSFVGLFPVGQWDRASRGYSKV